MSPTEYGTQNAEMVDVCPYGPLWLLHPGIQTIVVDKYLAEWPLPNIYVVCNIMTI